MMRCPYAGIAAVSCRSLVNTVVIRVFIHFGGTIRQGRKRISSGRKWTIGNDACRELRLSGEQQTRGGTTGRQTQVDSHILPQQREWPRVSDCVSWLRLARLAPASVCAGST